MFIGCKRVGFKRKRSDYKSDESTYAQFRPAGAFSRGILNSRKDIRRPISIKLCQDTVGHPLLQLSNCLIDATALFRYHGPRFNHRKFCLEGPAQLALMPVGGLDKRLVATYS